MSINSGADSTRTAADLLVPPSGCSGSGDWNPERWAWAVPLASPASDTGGGGT